MKKVIFAALLAASLSGFAQEAGKKDGADKMMQKMKRGKSVFTWDRFITKNKLDKYPKQIKDLNDLVIAVWQTKSKCLKEIEDYFSNSPLDAYYL